MICPMLGCRYERAGERLDFNFYECQEKECKWWDKEHKECAFLVIAQKLTLINRGLAK